MKTRFLLVVVLLASLLAACKPAAPDFSGTWTGNVAILTLTQTGDKVTGSVEGYGGQWNFSVAGTVSGTILTFSGDTPLGALAIVISKDGKTFRSADPALAFCATRGETLPQGCGFSGEWKLKADFLPEGSTAKLTQSGANVTGAAYGPDGGQLTLLTSVVAWGKGWFATGTNDWGDFILSMTGDEKAFDLVVPAQPAKDKNNREWCGLREGETLVYVFAFDCTIP